MTNNPSLKILFLITILNYLAQIPYYIINYYIPYHTKPSLMSVILLVTTLVWFLIGYFYTKKKNVIGHTILIIFLLAEGVFYGLTLLTGTFIFQLSQPNIIIKLVFLVGYVSGITALYYVYVLVRQKKKYLDNV